MPRLKSCCASALQEVSKLTVPSVASSARAAWPSARPVDSVIAIARVVFIALLHFFGCFGRGSREPWREVIERDLIFIAALCYPENGREPRKAGADGARPMQ